MYVMKFGIFNKVTISKLSIKRTFESMRNLVKCLFDKNQTMLISQSCSNVNAILEKKKSSYLLSVSIMRLSLNKVLKKHVVIGEIFD